VKRRQLVYASMHGSQIITTTDTTLGSSSTEDLRSSFPIQWRDLHCHALHLLFEPQYHPSYPLNTAAVPPAPAEFIIGSAFAFNQQFAPLLVSYERARSGFSTTAAH